MRLGNKRRKTKDQAQWYEYFVVQQRAEHMDDCLRSPLG
jgi:hypothetical protein